ncbi:hypothetical protein H2201_000016 [Coniosporium apollinis]|uniref:NmrA-like domain-containing protein n=1 Tax=Coniosporium apollinis TaxID=61459 RepID=A0ABQ9P6C6_9PEZI|nr:hypothetical protein H2201_000016 [Coniosporium apollinis]
MSKAILVTGATGKQGGAVINALLAENADFTILALTRTKASASAEKLAAKSPKIKLVEGNMDDCPAIFESAKEVTSEPIWGVFSVQVPMGKGASPETEERQGKALIDASLSAGVEFFVYASVDRGGDKSSNNPTYIPHFISKHNIEKHLEAQTNNGERMGYCVLRPTAFFDNMTPDFMGKGFNTAWKVAVKERPLQLIAVRDIGVFAAKAFMNPEEYRGQYISLAGDELAFADAAKIFKEKTGEEIPTTYEFLAHGMLWAVKEMGLMMKWFYEEGYGANIQELKKTHPDLLDFGAWLETQSGFHTK